MSYFLKQTEQTFSKNLQQKRHWQKKDKPVEPPSLPSKSKGLKELNPGSSLYEKKKKIGR